MNPTTRAGRALLIAAAAVCVLGTACATTVSGQAFPSATGVNATPVPPGPTAAPAPTSAPAPATGRTPDASRQDIEVIDQGFTTWEEEFIGTQLSYSALLRNPNPDTWVATSVDLTVTFRDAAGTVVAVDDLSTVYTVAPGADAAATAGVGLEITAAGATTMEVVVDEVYWQDTADTTPGSLTFGPATTRPDTARTGSPGLLVSCAVTSTYASVQNTGSVTVVYRDATGSIIGGSGHFAASDAETIAVPGDATTPVELRDLFPPPPSVPAAECYPSYVTS